MWNLVETPIPPDNLVNSKMQIVTTQTSVFPAPQQTLCSSHVESPIRKGHIDALLCLHVVSNSPQLKQCVSRVNWYCSRLRHRQPLSQKSHWRTPPGTSQTLSKLVKLDPTVFGLQAPQCFHNQTRFGLWVHPKRRRGKTVYFRWCYDCGGSPIEGVLNVQKKIRRDLLKLR